MENCDVKFGDACQTTRNVTAKAIVALFVLHATASIWLKDVTDTYVFPDENGLLPVLDPFATYHVEVWSSWDQDRRHGRKRPVPSTAPSATLQMQHGFQGKGWAVERQENYSSSH